MIDSEIAERFQPYLGARERVRWTGRPRQGLMLGPRDLFLIPFSMVWLGFVVFWEFSVLRQGGPMFFRLWGAMFLAIGLFFFAGRFLVDAWARSRTIYALSGERALILRWTFGMRLLSANLDRTVKLKGVVDGRGNLEFGHGAGFASDRGFLGMAHRQDMSMWTPSLSDRVQFLGVDDVMEAYRCAMPGPPAP